MAFKPPHGALGNAKNNPKNHQRSKMTQTRAETARSTQFFSSLLVLVIVGDVVLPKQEEGSRWVFLFRNSTQPKRRSNISNRYLRSWVVRSSTPTMNSQ